MTVNRLTVYDVLIRAHGKASVLCEMEENICKKIAEVSQEIKELEEFIEQIDSLNNKDVENDR